MCIWRFKGPDLISRSGVFYWFIFWKSKSLSRPNLLQLRKNIYTITTFSSSKEEILEHQVHLSLVENRYNNWMHNASLCNNTATKENTQLSVLLIVFSNVSEISTIVWQNSEQQGQDYYWCKKELSEVTHSYPYVRESRHYNKRLTKDFIWVWIGKLWRQRFARSPKHGIVSSSSVDWLKRKIRRFKQRCFH